MGRKRHVPHDVPAVLRWEPRHRPIRLSRYGRNALRKERRPVVDVAVTADGPATALVRRVALRR